MLAEISDEVQEDMYDKSRPKPPKFRTQIQPQTTLKEGDSAHFECRLVPIGDPTMKVEWYKDGMPVQQGDFIF